MTISEFIARCDRYCEAVGRTRKALSKQLLLDTSRIDDLEAGGTDIGVNRLERASSDLAALEAELSKRTKQDTAAQRTQGKAA